jgi:hypothetical protein
VGAEFNPNYLVFLVALAAVMLIGCSRQHVARGQASLLACLTAPLLLLLNGLRRAGGVRPGARCFDPAPSSAFRGFRWAASGRSRGVMVA